MIELKNITKTYGPAKVGFRALRGVDLKIEQGEFVAITGHSGSGKSTLLHILGFLDKPSSGSYTFFGKEASNLKDSEAAVLRNRLVGFVFQQFFLLPRMSALENVRLPLIYAGKRSLKENAKEKLKKVGLSEKESNRSNELSGGEQQRAAIARALVNDPAIILADEPTGNLDSQNEQEIVSILGNLNKEGKTIIIVTHEKDIAEHADRIISMRDGRIISDRKVKEISREPKVSLAKNLMEGALPKKKPALGKAELIDHLRQASLAILAHKLRSALSILGILIGIAAVIAMLSLVEGVKASISEDMLSLGANTLILNPGAYKQRGVALETGRVTRFTLEDAEAIAKSPLIKGVSPIVRDRAQLVYGNKNWNSLAQGTGLDYARIHNSLPSSGRYFSEEELKNRQKVAVIGAIVLKELFKGEPPLEKTIKINQINFQVIGVMPEKGAASWGSEDDVVNIPITTAMHRLMGKDYVDAIDIEVSDPSLLKEAEGAIGKIIINRHNLKVDDKDSFEILSLKDVLETMESTAKTMRWLLGSIAAISLLVGGIGIMNIMLVSVTERTREIGLRKAIGAKRLDIISQFLIESVVMSLIGGFLGLIFGAGFAMIIAAVSDLPRIIPPYSLLLATVFSIMVGIGFGIGPAFKASQLDPIEAIRYE